MPTIQCTIIEAALFRFDNKEPLYLMLKRSQHETLYPNAWQIVTGSIEHGETAVQASLREVKEETGYTPQRFWVVPHVNTFYAVKNDTVHHTVVFAGQVPPGSDPVLSEEHDEFGWYPLEKAKAMCVWPGQVTSLQIVHDYIVNGKKSAEFSEIIL